MGREKAYYIAAQILGILVSLTGLALLAINIYLSIKMNLPGFATGILPWLLTFGGLGILGWGANGMYRLGYAKVRRYIRVAAQEIKVYQDTDSRSPVVATLGKGSGAEFDAAMEVDGVDWVRIQLPTGQQGYVTNIGGFYVTLKATIDSREATVYKYADLSEPISQLVNGSEVELNKGDLDTTDLEGALPSVLAWLSDGQEGYIRKGTKFKWV
jgi:hypothetical protein